MKRIAVLVVLLSSFLTHAQSAWPSEIWNSATNLTAVMNSSGLTELSGLHWNPVTNRLYVVHGDGRLRVLQLNTTTGEYTQIGNKTIAGGPEGITQVNLSANEFYTVDENNYEIRKYTHTANFGTVTESKHWDLLLFMDDTGNTGPEGIAFVPNSALAEAGFTSSVTSQPYTATKGMDGLIFIAHQDGGYVWVFDVNPNVNDDFAFVGKYRTSRTESCDLAFDESAGILYILHNTGSNYLEATDLSLAPGSDAKFATVAEYFIANPAGNDNIEGFAISNKCPEGSEVKAWLCRDVESGESTAHKQDAIREFSPFTAAGECVPLGTPVLTSEKITISPNPAGAEIAISLPGEIVDGTLVMRNTLGQVVLSKNHLSGNRFLFSVASLQAGIYFLEISDGSRIHKIKWIKK